MSYKGQGNVSPRELFACLKSNRHSKDNSFVKSSQNVNIWSQVKSPFSSSRPKNFNKKNTLQYIDSKNEVPSNTSDQYNINYKTSKHEDVQERKDPYENEEKSIIEGSEFLDVFSEKIIEEENIQLNNTRLKTDKEDNELVTTKAFITEQINSVDVGIQREYHCLDYTENISNSQSIAKLEHNISNELTSSGSDIDFAKDESKSFEKLIVEDEQNEQKCKSPILKMKCLNENKADLNAQYVTLIEGQATDSLNKSVLEERPQEIRANTENTKINMNTSQLFPKQNDLKTRLINLISEVDSLNEFVLCTAEALKTQKKKISERNKVRNINDN